MLRIKDEELNKINGGYIIYHPNDYQYPFEVVTDEKPHEHLLSCRTEASANIVAWWYGVSAQLILEHTI